MKTTSGLKLFFIWKKRSFTEELRSEPNGKVKISHHLCKSEVYTGELRSEPIGKVKISHHKVNLELAGGIQV